MLKISLTLLVLLWAGVSIGSNLIAAPAKFQVVELPLKSLLQVGRAQFSWVGYAEWAFAALVVICGMLAGRSFWWLVLPVCVFLIQQLIIMPSLDARTIQIVEGIAVPHSNLHIYVIVLEIVKVMALSGCGIFILLQAQSGA